MIDLLDMVDLAEFGEPPAQPKPWMSASVTTPLTLTSAETQGQAAETLRFMASGFGFLDPGI